MYHSWQISRNQSASNAKHLPANHSTEPIHLSRILLHLSSYQETLQATGFLWQLEELLPFVLVERWLLLLHAQRILLLSLGLPSCNLSLFATKTALVILSVVLFCLVLFDAVQEKIGRLL